MCKVMRATVALHRHDILDCRPLEQLVRLQPMSYVLVEDRGSDQAMMGRS